MSTRADELDRELVVLRRHNEQLTRLTEQAIRMGETLLRPARETVSAYREYARLAPQGADAVEPAARRLAAAVDKLSCVVGDAK
jgi:hypothetical protein